MTFQLHSFRGEKLAGLAVVAPKTSVSGVIPS